MGPNMVRSVRHSLHHTPEGISNTVGLQTVCPHINCLADLELLSSPNTEKVCKIQPRKILLFTCKSKNRPHFITFDVELWLKIFLYLVYTYKMFIKWIPSTIKNYDENTIFCPDFNFHFSGKTLIFNCHYWGSNRPPATCVLLLIGHTWHVRLEGSGCTLQGKAGGQCGSGPAQHGGIRLVHIVRVVDTAARWQHLVAVHTNWDRSGADYKGEQNGTFILMTVSGWWGKIIPTYIHVISRNCSFKNKEIKCHNEYLSKCWFLKLHVNN